MEENQQVNEDTLFYQAALLGGLVSALTDAVPGLILINCLCFLGIALGGMVAVHFVRRRVPGKIFSNAEIIRLGLLTAIAGAFLAFVAHFVVYQIIGNWQVEWLMAVIENMDEIPQVWEEIYEELQTPAMQGFAGVAILVRSLILFPIFTIAGAWFARRAIEKRAGH